MTNIGRAAVAIATLLVLLPVDVAAQPVTVWLSDNEFTPFVAEVPGPGPINGTVTWEAHPSQPPVAPHNVREEHKLFYSGEPTTWTTKEFTRIFSAGTFDYLCEVHGASMSGIVKVRMNQSSRDGLPLMIWAHEESNTGRVFDVQFRIGTGRWRNWKVDTEKFRGVFGRNDRPVPFDDAAFDYYFRSRSQKRPATPLAHSRWSPPVLFD